MSDINRINNFLKSYYQSIIRINSRQFSEAKTFVFLWNLFEHTLYKDDYGVHKSTVHLSSLSLNKTTVNAIFQFFKTRYGDNTYLEKLNLTEECKNYFKSLHDKEYPRYEDKVTYIEIILYRFRCNFFHGNKEIKDLWSQKDCFDKLNDFILECLEANQQIKSIKP